MRYHITSIIIKEGLMATTENWLQNPIKGLLLDISGVLKNGNVPIPGSVEAFRKLQSSKLPYRLVTNETSHPISKIVSSLNMMEYDVSEDILFSPVPAVVKILREKNLRPQLMVHPEVIPDFLGMNTSDPNCVVLGDAVEYFQYETLNECFRILMNLKNPILYSLGQGKYYQEQAGLSLDVGPFCKALEYATGIKAITVGKPCPEFFMAAVSDLNLQPSEVVMIGDDIVSDIGGAQVCGLRGVLVRTGKYRQDRDEPHEKVVPDGYVDNLLQAVDLILKHNRSHN